MSARNTGTEELFAALPEVDEVAQRRLHARLAAEAAEQGILDVAYRTVDTPVGTLLVAATGQGLVRIAYLVREDPERVLVQLSERVSPRVLRDPAHLGLDEAAREIDEYFGGRRRRFDLPLDFRLSHGFRRTILSHLLEIDYGSTASSAAVAAAAGSPRAVRAVGTACATNPLPLVVPCHRVIRSDGLLGGYAGGPESKAALLALESGAG